MWLQELASSPWSLMWWDACGGGHICAHEGAELITSGAGMCCKICPIMMLCGNPITTAHIPHIFMWDKLSSPPRWRCSRFMCSTLENPDWLSYIQLSLAKKGPRNISRPCFNNVSVCNMSSLAFIRCCTEGRDTLLRLICSGCLDHKPVRWQRSNRRWRKFKSLY